MCFLCVPLILWATERAWFLSYLYAVDDTAFYACCCCLYRLVRCHRNWVMPCRYTTILHRSWRDALARPSIPYHYAFSGHLKSSFDSLSFLSLHGPPAYKPYCCTSCFSSFAAHFRLYALAILYIYSAPQSSGSICVHSLCFHFSFVPFYIYAPIYHVPAAHLVSSAPSALVISFLSWCAAN